MFIKNQAHKHHKKGLYQNVLDHTVELLSTKHGHPVNECGPCFNCVGVLRINNFW